MEIRDTRNGDWHWVYNAVLADPHLTDADKVVYSSISTFGGHQVIHPTTTQIGERCNISERQVRYSLRKLEEVEYLKIEMSVGRGNANVYYLLKAPKGCKLCPIYKWGKEEQEKGQTTTVKGGATAPHIDKIDSKDSSIAPLREVVVVKENAEEHPKKESRAKYPHSKEIFALWGTSSAFWARNTTQLSAAEDLYSLLGIEEIKACLGFLDKHKDDKFCPEIHTPHDLLTKYQKLEAFSYKV